MARLKLVAGMAVMLMAAPIAASQVSAAGLKIVDGGIPASLTGAAGDPAAGRDAMINRKQGNCLACHEITALKEEPFHGEVGPSLDDVASRYNEAQLRLLVADSKKVFDGTIMPAFHRTTGLNRVAKKFNGKTILSAQQVEDIVAYLKTLKD